MADQSMAVICRLLVLNKLSSKEIERCFLAVAEETFVLLATFALLQLDDWCKFDVFKVAQLADGAPLQRVTLALLDRFDLVDKLHLDRGKLQSFLRVRP